MKGGVKNMAAIHEGEIDATLSLATTSVAIIRGLGGKQSNPEGVYLGTIGDAKLLATRFERQLRDPKDPNKVLFGWTRELAFGVKRRVLGVDGLPVWSTTPLFQASDVIGLGSELADKVLTRIKSARRLGII
ncbi:hypothetical protein A3C59_00905 [Candidatus Daviesbacteria bacterium RIFCSPHIGHO2_02_FULL_36_13]|uniref:Uncharacterized protein n=1 Tax=Candidatus Daviesbacteria bacterium RIFCSPHIGHO2_02_FULL_36_13 TaxID=1797768 RepID=A0A1F5JRN4_9BACT|nr:MAG: hypothetical protein A3C59_00905 [Candidatus Daviesbacteria bacterium RIFCSPHIGHO2_02_FULL_36_13]